MRTMQVLARAVVASALVLTLCCDWFWPDLEPVRLYAKEGHYLCRPVVSSDGNTMYFLDDSVPFNRVLTIYSCSGALYAYSFVDSSERLLLAGDYHRLALSDERSLLAVGTLDSVSGEPGIVLVDTSGTVLQMFTIKRPFDRCYFGDVRFAKSGQRIVYSFWTDPPGYPSRTYFYSKGLVGDTSTSLVREVGWAQRGLDVFGGDSVYADQMSKYVYPDVNPVNSRWVVFVADYSGLTGPRFALHDRRKDKMVSLGRKSRPPGMYVAWPTWMPNGRDFIFSAGLVSGAGTHWEHPAEIWLLTDIVDP
ncbi:MAG: hypothetical protein JSU73_06820 [candidate division WOR-3 bacterium]|nr:MAG: hypothetical protein JSU73_06820 [candidate division WOR-3 bacterium]